MTLKRSHPDLYVGGCVPFYFCPRSVMLYQIFKGNNSELTYSGGQELIIHLEADLQATVAWAQRNIKRWAFTLSNAGAYYFEDRKDLNMLNEIDWESVNARIWSGEDVPSIVKEHKMAEFLLEDIFPWHLVERIGVYSDLILRQVKNLLPTDNDRPQVEIMREWYY